MAATESTQDHDRSGETALRSGPTARVGVGYRPPVSSIITGSESGAQERVDATKQINLEAINAQTMRLGFSVLVVAGILAMGYIWSGVLPAVNVLDSVTLWRVQGVTPNEVTPITLARVLWAIPVIVLTFVGASNLPGILEIALLQQLPSRIRSATRSPPYRVMRFDARCRFDLQ